MYIKKLDLFNSLYKRKKYSKRFKTPHVYSCKFARKLVISSLYKSNKLKLLDQLESRIKHYNNVH